MYGISSKQAVPFLIPHLCFYKLRILTTTVIMKLFLIPLQGSFCNEWVKVFCMFSHTVPSFMQLWICSLWVEWVLCQVSVSSITKCILHVLSYCPIIHATVNTLIMSWVSAVSSISIKHYQMHSARSLTKISASKCNSCSNIYNVRIHHQTQWVWMELK